MKSTLPVSLDYLFGHEGGYVDHPNDPGGPTKYGITHKTLAAHRGVTLVTKQQVKDMTKAEAEEIYRKSYWNQSGGDLLPAGVDHVVFDMGVNAGPGTAVKILQRVLGFTGKDVDGVVGVKTADQADKWPTGLAGLIEEYSAARLDYYRKLKTWSKFGRGWTNRVNKAEKEAIALAMGQHTLSAAVAPDQITPKAPPEPEKARRDPLAWLAGAQPVLGGILAASPENGPLPWFIGASMFILAATAVYLLVQRKRSEEA